MVSGLSENVLSVEFFGIILFICYHPKYCDCGLGCHSIQYYTFSKKFSLLIDQ